MFQDFTNFEDTVRTSHDEMDRQMAPFRPQLPAWAIPDDVRDKWAPMLPQNTSNEVCFGVNFINILLVPFCTELFCTATF